MGIKRGTPKQKGTPKVGKAQPRGGKPPAGTGSTKKMSAKMPKGR